MKALSLTQPWATLVAIGAKKIETRSWRTNYRGSIAIHAAKGFPTAARQFSMTRAVWQVTALDRASDYPRGCVIAIGFLDDVVPIESLFDQPRLTFREKMFGDYSPGRFGWILNGVQQFDKPIPAKGALGLWEWMNVPPMKTGKEF